MTLGRWFAAALTASYEYEDDQLTRIHTPSTTYKFYYDSFGLRSSVYAGSYILACYEYSDDADHYLNSIEYGNRHINYYDNAGNILTKNEYAYTTGDLGAPIDTITYAYNDSYWGDLLTAYDSTAITYDTIGNPLNDGTWTYTWRNGRELATMSDGTITWTYTYDANGMRTQRSNGTTTYNYVYNGSQLSQMSVGSNTLNFAYDASGMPMMVTYNGTNYYYIVNLQGDVMGIIDGAGNVVVNYTYNAWGNPLSITGSMADTLSAQNPLRYRGYVYDTETGFYYLQSRYYDPEIGRFINADSLVTTGQGLLGNNMFAYCLNNPVSRIDATGMASVSYSTDDETPWDDLLPENMGRGGGSGGGFSAAFRATLQSALNGLNMAMGSRDLSHKERHHMFSNKNKTYTPQYKEIMERYNMSLTAQENMVYLPGHSGRHTNTYHEYMLQNLKELDAIANGDCFLFREGFQVFADFLAEYWWIPYAK